VTPPVCRDRLAVNQAHVNFNKIGKMIENMALHRRVKADVLADLGENLVPGTAYLLM
jgi:hypothetical protein